MNGAVAQAELPGGALLERYRTEGGHVDCYIAEVPRAVDLGQLITAFYTSPAFRPERWLLGALLGKRADNGDVARLAAGETDRFSAWAVEARGDDQILLCDFQGRTRSWLMVQPIVGGTRLHFGSAVVPQKRRADRLVFSALLGFHRWYSRALLKGAVKRL
jgi:hypothetical protein